MKNKNKGDKFLNILMIILAIATAIVYAYHYFIIRPINQEKMKNKMERLEELNNSILDYDDIKNIYREGE